MDPLHFTIATGPLAAYFLLLGGLNLLQRPILTTGARDTAVLGIALSGFVVAGPMELFLPEAAAFRFGAWVWVLMLSFYFLCLVLVVLLLRPRLVVYNIAAEQLRPVLANVVAGLDKDCRWVGEILILPQLDVQLQIESSPLLRNVQLVAAGSRQSYAGWRQLEISLAEALSQSRGQSNPIGFALITLAVIITSGALLWMASDSQGVAQALNQMLRR
ncbi:MAG: hypothetical protein RIC55_01145 [Pirellulaceae bacterium]